MRELETSALVVGGGAGGLTSSINLSEMGTSSILLERHPTLGRLPKARYLNPRTMEVFRQIGVADAVYKKSMPRDYISAIRWCTSLAGDGPLDRKTFFRIDSFGGGDLTDYDRDSPCPATLYPQVRLEPLLRAEAEARNPGGLLFNHELLSFEQDGETVRALVRDRATEEEFIIKAQYLIAADGGRTIGPAVGSRLEGKKDLSEMVTVYFRADLSQWWDDDHAMTTWFVNPEGGSWASGVLGKLGPTKFDRHSEEWMFHFRFRTDDPARFDEEALVPRMRELLKLPDLEPDIIGIGHWVVEGVLADRYRFDRVFLVGDAAHRHPPTTGLGLNSAVQDAHNLTWKPDAVLKGRAGDDLLDTYEAERRPVADRNVKWALMTFENHQLTDVGIGLIRGNAEVTRQNFHAFFEDDDEGRTRRRRLQDVMSVQRMEWQAHDVEMGFHYESGSIVPDGTAAPERDPMGGKYIPTTRPGHRLPHAWLEKDGNRVSTLNLTAPGESTLITGPEGSAWAAAATALAAQGMPLRSVTVGKDCDYQDVENNWSELCGISAGGAILVRPDTHVGWRVQEVASDPEQALHDAMESSLCVS